MRSLPRRQAEEESEIDLTPMLDVVFIMLIFFIVTASFIKEQGIEISRPDANQEQSTPTENKNIVIQVTASDEIWMEGRRIDQRAVRANITRMKAENPEASVIIQAHNKSTADVYTQIADSARSAGIPGVSLVTKGD
ncbi:biopolymer transport protein ExbD [Sinobacterium caligoides]|uniref:Biopolymer transport protein ExbD n=1 Tax=Sinobacterium caligoides TaxID=933926 RepID=A0A3N2DQ12_9GAMM|nr:biopolymer transporter ExbD [Sinobacterium caligoides]ROS01405.1 biopolymer transport protein ExbD [Sinobacterium caligoides]